MIKERVEQQKEGLQDLVFDLEMYLDSIPDLT